MTKKDGASDSNLKSKRIVYQMSRELQKTDVNDDFQNALLSMEMEKSEKSAGFQGFLELQNQIKESLKNHMASGTQEGLLSLLTARQMRSVTQMLNRKSSSEDFDPHYGEIVVPKRIQVVEDDDRIPEAPGKPLIPKIPKLDVGRLAYDDPEDEQSLEWVSSNPGRSSSRIPDLPLEPEPEPEPKPQTPKVQFEAKPAHVPKRIKSKPRPVPKSDAQMQTDEVEIETVSAAVSAREPEKEKVDTVDIGTTCRLLTTPRVEEHVEVFQDDRSQILSPMSIITDISEGEVIGLAAAKGQIITVRTDGSLVQPRVHEEDYDDRYFGESETDLLRATSSSPLQVVEVDMSVSSTPTSHQ